MTGHDRVAESAEADRGVEERPPSGGDHTTDQVAKWWVLGTTLVCIAAGLAGHGLLWWGFRRGVLEGPIPGWTWQPIIGLSLTAVAIAAFGGFYIASRRARTAIAASFLLTFLMSYTYALTISGFADLQTRGAEQLFNDFRAICVAIIAAYFGSESVITTTKVIQVARTAGATADDIKTADRDLATSPTRGMTARAG